jgi:hypothetical protein
MNLAPGNVNSKRRSTRARTASFALSLAAALALVLCTVDRQGTVRADEGPSLAATPVAESSAPTTSNQGNATANSESEGEAEQPTDGSAAPSVGQTPATTNQNVVPSLTYAIAKQPTCAPPAALSAAAFGDPFVYDCALDVHFEADHVAPSEVNLVLEVSAEAGAGWIARVSTAANDDFSSDSASSTATANLGGLVDGDALGSWAFTMTQRFKVQVQSISCGAVASAAKISSKIGASLPSRSDVEVTRTGGSPSHLSINPSPPRAEAPAVSFNGGLDFGSVPVTTNGPEVSQRHSTVSLTVSGLDATCGDWRIVLRVIPGDDADSTVLAPSTLRLVAVNGAPVANGGCTLDNDCLVDVVSSGPEASPTLVYNLSVTMTLPDEPVVGSFNATLTTVAEAAD